MAERFGEALGWISPAQRFARAAIQLIGDQIERELRDAGEVGCLGSGGRLLRCRSSVVQGLLRNTLLLDDVFGLAEEVE